MEDDYEVGEEVSQLVKFSDFGRAPSSLCVRRWQAASSSSSTILCTISTKTDRRSGDRRGVSTWKRETLLVDDENNELLLPRTEQIPGDFFRKGETARAVISRVDNSNGTPRIILSRTDPAFLQRMLEAEVPEIQDGLITIHKVARIPGERAKVAVESYDDRIDPWVHVWV